MAGRAVSPKLSVPLIGLIMLNITIAIVVIVVNNDNSNLISSNNTDSNNSNSNNSTKHGGNLQYEVVIIMIIVVMLVVIYLAGLEGLPCMVSTSCNSWKISVCPPYIKS